MLPNQRTNIYQSLPDPLNLTLICGGRGNDAAVVTTEKQINRIDDITFKDLLFPSYWKRQLGKESKKDSTRRPQFPLYEIWVSPCNRGFLKTGQHLHNCPKSCTLALEDILCYEATIVYILFSSLKSLKNLQR